MIKRKSLALALLFATIFSFGAFASIQGYNSSNTLLGQFSKVKCSTGFTCTKSGTQLVMAAAATTDPYFTIGSGTAVDVGFAFDGSALDFNISLDDSASKLVIGKGLVAGTTDAIRIDTNQDVTIVQSLIGLGTDQLYGFLNKQVAATATTITASQCGSSFINTGAVAMNLPEASTVLGCRLTFITGNASNFDVNPDDADQILIQTNAAGDSMRNATLGASITLEAISASQWTAVAISGTYTDIN